MFTGLVQAALQTWTLQFDKTDLAQTALCPPSLNDALDNFGNVHTCHSCYCDCDVEGHLDCFMVQNHHLSCCVTLNYCVNAGIRLLGEGMAISGIAHGVCTLECLDAL